MEEIWRDVGIYEGSYQVSDIGNVRSIWFDGGTIKYVLEEKKN